MGKRKTALYLAIALAVVSVNAQDLQQQSRQAGIAAFNAGRYQEALDLFEAQERSGNQSESVQYNIAVSLYRLGRLAEAETIFLQLRELPAWRVLADYNLGLVKEAQGDRTAALEYYSRSAQQTEQLRIRDLADRKLDQLLLAGSLNTTTDLPRSASSTRPWAALLSISAGEDSNASSLADELIDQSASVEDSYSELLLYGHSYLKGGRGNGLRLYGLGFGRQFSEFDYLDSQVAGLGLVYEKPLFGLQTEWSARFISTRLDSELVADQTQLSANLSRQFTPGTFSLGLHHSEFSAGDDFPQVDGSQQRLDLGWSKRLDSWLLSLRYRHEINDRADLSRGNAFASYSPVRDSVKAEARWQISNQLLATASIEVSESDYDDANLLRDTDGQVKHQQRDTRRSQAGVGLDYRFNRDWKVSLNYRHADVDDSFLLYTYDKRQVFASLEYQF